jgi:hypothetical protein
VDDSLPRGRPAFRSTHQLAIPGPAIVARIVLVCVLFVSPLVARILVVI